MVLIKFKLTSQPLKKIFIARILKFAVSNFFFELSIHFPKCHCYVRIWTAIKIITWVRIILCSSDSCCWPLLLAIFLAVANANSLTQVIIIIFQTVAYRKLDLLTHWSCNMSISHLITQWFSSLIFRRHASLWSRKETIFYIYV